MQPLPVNPSLPANPDSELHRDTDAHAARWERWAAALLAVLCEA